MNTKIDRSTILILTTLLLFGLPILGCSSGLRTEFVEGTVTLEGEPLEGASVTFTPVSGNTARMAVGFTDARGRYTLTTAEGGSPGRGTTQGDYKITIAKRAPNPAWRGEQESPAVVERADPSQPPTPREEAVAAAAAERARRAAGLAPPRVYLSPQKYGNPETSGLTATVVRGRNTFDFALTEE